MSEGIGGPLQYQLQMLAAEVDVVNATIRQMDDISKNLKQWTITVWAASVGGALSTASLTRYVWATAAIPLLFWLVDSAHHVVQRKFIWRSLRIMDFLNDGRLGASYQAGHLVDFVVMDVANRRQRDDPEFNRFTAWTQVLLFRTLSILYIGLAALSLTIAIFFHGRP